MYLEHTTAEEDLPLFTTYTKTDLTSPAINIYTSTIRSLSSQLSLGNLTSLQIVTAYLRQIDVHNPKLKALIHVGPREGLMALAREMDDERKEGKCRGVLHGIPIVLKDNIETDPSLGMPTTAGSYALRQFLPNLPGLCYRQHLLSVKMSVRRDAFLVRKLRETGAIIIGKANLSELASYKSLNADGWSAVGGQTINVYASHASPGSSSAGNGVSIAAGFCPASVGTDTDGSVVFPSFASALYGLKPTHGLLSRTGIVPFAPTFDSAGPMGKTPWDLAVLLDVMSDEDVEDLATVGVQRLEEGVKVSSHLLQYSNTPVDPMHSMLIAPPIQASEDFVSASLDRLFTNESYQNWLDVEPWKRAGKPDLSREIYRAFESAVSKMANAGATIIDPADIPSAMDDTLWQCADGARSVIVNADCKEYLGRYLNDRAGDGEGCRSVEDLIAFNEEQADLELPPDHPSQDVLKRTRYAVPVDSPIYHAAKSEMQLVAGLNGLDAVFDSEGVNVLFSLADGHQSLPNMVGYPMGAAWEAEFGPRPLPPMATEDLRLQVELEVEEVKVTALAIQASDSAR
ncbi:hypothetical protein QFC20_004936 [Naganishia adeliensis]|uniref:Uncharacterized protein n=1 Tax=Naganishia adeliensis TaxID=92952 RepID=A0ACC2VUS3_9TREE|nr:hypothetical protein QFC20_004936 [Naganishia adeliensis]